MLNHQQNFDFAGYCTDSAACIEMVKKHDIDILLLDVQIENAFSGITLIPQLLAIAPELKIIMLTGYSSSDYIFEAITNGASDYVIKECSMEEILNKIKAVYEGQVLLSEEISKKFISKSRELSTAHKSLIYVLDKMVMLSGGERCPKRLV